MHDTNKLTKYDIVGRGFFLVNEKAPGCPVVSVYPVSDFQDLLGMSLVLAIQRLQDRYELQAIKCTAKNKHVCTWKGHTS